MKGAFSAGIKVTVTSLSEASVIELDPITTQLYMQSDLTGTANLGLLTATVSGDASLRGEFKLGYCPFCEGVFPLDDSYEQARYSSFYFSRLIGYNLTGALELSQGIPGVVVGAGAGILGIEDGDVYGDSPPMIQLPNALLDSIKFSPQTAVGKPTFIRTL